MRMRIDVIALALFAAAAFGIVLAREPERQIMWGLMSCIAA